MDLCPVHLFHEREVLGDDDVVKRQIRLGDLEVIHRRATTVDACAEPLELTKLRLAWDVADLVETGTGVGLNPTTSRKSAKCPLRIDTSDQAHTSTSFRPAHCHGQQRTACTREPAKSHALDAVGAAQ